MITDQIKPNLPADLGVVSTAWQEEFNAGLEARQQAIRKLRKMNARQPKNLFQTIKDYRECSQIVIELVEVLEAAYDSQRADIKVLTGSSGSRERKRWTPGEDTALVSMAAGGDETLLQLAVAFRRSPGAISSRLTYLVGISRISQEVAGRVTGFIDGEPVDGYLVGVVTKQGVA